MSGPTSASAALLATVVRRKAGGITRPEKVAPRLTAAPAASVARVVGRRGWSFMYSCILLVRSVLRTIGRAMEFLIFSPPFLVGCAGVLLYRGLRAVPHVHWGYSSASVFLFLLASIVVGWLARGSGLGLVFAFALGGCSIAVLFIETMWIVWCVPRWRKLGAGVVFIAVSVLFWQSILYGETQSPEMITQRNGTTIVGALDQYYRRYSHFPATLQELTPQYFSELPVAVTTQNTGWLYALTDDTYTLGYWYWPDKHGVMLCTYSSAVGRWKCSPTLSYRDWEPFPVVLTPAPGE